MPLKRAYVGPEPSNLQYFVYRYQVVHNIVCSVDKETSYDTIPCTNLSIIDFPKLACYHAKVIWSIWAIHLNVWAHIRNLCSFENVLVGTSIAVAMDVWIDCELIWLFWGIEYEVRRKKTEIGELIALCFKASFGKFEDKSSQAAARHQNTNPFSCFRIIRLHAFFFCEIMYYFIYQRFVALISFFLAKVRPLSNKWFKCWSHLNDILGSHSFRSHHDTSIWQLISIEQAWMIDNNLVQEKLILTR